MAENAATVEDRLTAYLEAEEAEEHGVQEAPQEQAPAAQEVEAEEPEEVKAEQPEVEAEPAEEGEVEEVEISALAELMEHNELAPEAMYNLTIPVTLPDGTSKQVPLGEFKDSYQLTERLKTERSQLTEQAQRFEQEQQAKSQELEQLRYVATQVLEGAEKALVGNVDEARLNDLRFTDPAEYAALKADQDARKRGLNELKEQLNAEYNQKLAEAQQLQQQQWQQMAAEAHRVLPEFIPEWRDENVAKKEKAELKQYALTKLQPHEVDQLIDPRYAGLLYKAWKYDQQQASEPEKKKRVLTIGGKKVISGGKSKSKTERKADQRQQDYRQFKKGGGTVDDMAAFVEKYLLDED